MGPGPTSSEYFNRPPRIQKAGIQGEIDIPSPPKEPDEHTRNLLLSLLPMSGIMVMAGFYLVLGASTGRSPIFALPLMGMGVVSVLAALLTYSYQKVQQRKRAVKTRRDYHRLLDRREERLQAAREIQQFVSIYNYPPPHVLLRWIDHKPHYIWWRRPADADLLYIRLGGGMMHSSVMVKAPDPDTQAPDIRRAMDLAFVYREVPDTSVVLDLKRWHSVGIVGERDEALAFTYALVAHLVSFHAPTDLNLYVLSSQAGYINWNWARWLPHTSSTIEGGFPSYIAYDPEHLGDVVDELLRRITTRREALADPNVPQEDRALIVVVFDETTPIKEETVYRQLLANQQAGVIGLTLHQHGTDVPGECTAVVTVKHGQFRADLTGPEGTVLTGRADMLTRAQVEVLAHRLAHFRLPHQGTSGRIPTRLEFLQMYGARTLADLDIQGRWLRPVAKAGALPLPVPIGNTSFSSQLYFHLAENVHGPHGVIAGTTGAGKSELLQTLVTALAVEHHPFLVSFLLIDYKGGATFGIFKHLPHTVGLVTNLNKIEALRALEAIKSENRRRQRFLTERGFDDITEYHEQLAASGGQLPPAWEPLPHLLIVIDEFAELKSDLPNFLDELVATVRVGRSLGIHLILATQRPGGHVTEEMRANLQFRICLRVQNPEQSFEMLRRPDAAYLPSDIIGRAYFQIGTDTQQFQVAYAGMPYDEQQATADRETADQQITLVKLEQPNDLLSADAAAQAECQPAINLPKLSNALAQHMQGVFEQLDAAPLEPVLLQSLPGRIGLDHTMAHYRAGRDLGGWNGDTWQSGHDRMPGVRVPVGLVDQLDERAQPPLLVDFQDGSGHMLVVGTSGTGKTMMLRTLALSLAHLYTPEEVNLYVLSFAGRGLKPLEDLPHVGAVIFNDQRERLARLLHLLQTSLDERRREFARAGADDLAQYMLRRASQPELPLYPGVVVLIDNFSELRESFPNESDMIISLIRDGRAVGIHFVLTSPTIKLPTHLMGFVEQRLALRLSEKTDYMVIVGRTGEREVNPRPGSGLLRLSPTQPPQHVQLALPGSSLHEATAAQVDENADDELRMNDMLATIQAMKTAWAGPTPMPVESLSESVSLEPMLGVALTAETQPLTAPPVIEGQTALVTPLALDALTQRPLHLNWLTDGPHFVINGPIGSGKSSLLTALLLSVAARYSPLQTAMLLIDFGQQQRRLSTLPHVLGHVTDEDSLGTHLAHFMAELNWRRAEYETRRPELDTVEDRYPFAPIIIAIDDYDQMRDAIYRYQAMFNELGRSIRRDSHLGFHLLVAGETSNMASASDALLKQLRLMRSGFGLVSWEAVDLLGGRVNAAMRQAQLPDGRGYRVARTHAHLMQFVHSTNPAATIRTLREKWRSFAPAAWPHPADESEIEAFEQDKIAPPTSNLPGTGPLSGGLALDLAGALEDYKKQQGYDG